MTPVYKGNAKQSCFPCFFRSNALSFWLLGVAGLPHNPASTLLPSCFLWEILMFKVGMAMCRRCRGGGMKVEWRCVGFVVFRDSLFLEAFHFAYGRTTFCLWAYNLLPIGAQPFAYRQTVVGTLFSPCSDGTSTFFLRFLVPVGSVGTTAKSHWNN